MWLKLVSVTLIPSKEKKIVNHRKPNRYGISWRFWNYGVWTSLTLYIVTIILPSGTKLITLNNGNICEGLLHNKNLISMHHIMYKYIKYNVNNKYCERKKKHKYIAVEIVANFQIYI